MPIRQREYRIAGFRFFFSRLSFFFLLSRRNNGGLLRQTVYAVNNTVTLLLLIIAVIVGAGTNEEKLCSNVRHDSLVIQTSSIELHYVQSVTFLDCFCCCCLPWWRVRPSRSRNNSLRVSLLVVKREGERRGRELRPRCEYLYTVWYWRYRDCVDCLPDTRGAVMT